MSVNTYQISFSSNWNVVYSCIGHSTNNTYKIIGIPNNSNRVIYLYYPSVNGTDSIGNTLSYWATGPNMAQSYLASVIYIVYS